MRTLMFAGILLLIFAAPAGADERFQEMDSDNDGMVSWEEFSSAYPNMKRPAFDAIDANKDGRLSHEEWDGFRMSHARNKAMGGGQMPIMPMPQVDGQNGGQQNGQPDTLPLIKPPK